MIDAGGANLGSVCAAFARLGIEPEVSRDPARIAAAAKLVLPGVGAAAPVMRTLREHGLDAQLRESNTPLLGICIGMQVLFNRSEEGDVEGLGLLAGDVCKLPASPGLRLPHMGWNHLQRRRPSPLLEGIADGAQAYFVHSYAAPVTAATVASCDYGGAFAAVVSERNFHGAQFHPERSAAVGARLLANFLELQ